MDVRRKEVTSLGVGNLLSAAAILQECIAGKDVERREVLNGDMLNRRIQQRTSHSLAKIMSFGYLYCCVTELTIPPRADSTVSTQGYQ
jgi:hypothetical protein